ncbi:MAG: flagellar hook-associated protein 3 FlgL [Kiritimatiellia bacterium]|jgi:flagellar hook-associated protein 3 FlgL
MRISNLHIYNLANNSMAEANKEIVKTQQQLSTGKRVLTAADDPVAATRIQQLTDNMSMIEQYNKNIAFAEDNLATEEAALTSVTNLVQRMKELAVQAGNTASLSETEYDVLATEVDARLEELVSIANTRNANGDYIFAGYKSQTPAFSGDNVNGFRYMGDEGTNKIKVDNNTFVESSHSGKSIFVDVPSVENTIITSVNPNNRSMPPISISIGEVVDQQAYDDFYPEDIVITFNDDTNVSPPVKNFTVTEKSTGKIIAENQAYVAGAELVYNGVSVRITGNPASADTGANLNGDQLFVNSTSTQDVLTTLMRFRDAMQAVDGTQASRDLVAASVATTLDNLSHLENSVSKTVTDIGTRMNTLDNTKEQHLDTELVSKIILSDLRDLDYAEAASRLSSQTLILQAAQASFLRISELNLFSRM